MNTSEVLYTAADLIEKRGWGTGSWKPAAGPLCIEGAIAAARGIDNEYDSMENRCPAYYAVRNYLGDTPFAWNDHILHERVHELIDGVRNYEDLRAQAMRECQARVVATLRAAAVIEAAKERAEAREPVLA